MRVRNISCNGNHCRIICTAGQWRNDEFNILIFISKTLFHLFTQTGICGNTTCKHHLSRMIFLQCILRTLQQGAKRGFLIGCSQISGGKGFIFSLTAINELQYTALQATKGKIHWILCFWSCQLIHRLAFLSDSIHINTTWIRQSQHSSYLISSFTNSIILCSA